MLHILYQTNDLSKLRISFFQDSDEMLQSGEDTYFPALRIGMVKSSAVVISFIFFFLWSCMHIVFKLKD